MEDTANTEVRGQVRRAPKNGDTTESSARALCAAQRALRFHVVRRPGTDSGSTVH